MLDHKNTISDTFFVLLDFFFSFLLKKKILKEKKAIAKTTKSTIHIMIKFPFIEIFRAFAPKIKLHLLATIHFTHTALLITPHQVLRS